MWCYQRRVEYHHNGKDVDECIDCGPVYAHSIVMYKKKMAVWSKPKKGWWFVGMTHNRRIALNIVATYGRSRYALVIGLFCGRLMLMAN